MATNKDCAVIVNSVLDLGHDLGLKVIAEGVEDVRIWRMLVEKGCDFAQGFYMAKPMPEEFNRWLKSWRETAPGRKPRNAPLWNALECLIGQIALAKNDWRIVWFWQKIRQPNRRKRPPYKYPPRQLFLTSQ